MHAPRLAASGRDDFRLRDACPRTRSSFPADGAVIAVEPGVVWSILPRLRSRPHQLAAVAAARYSRTQLRRRGDSPRSAPSRPHASHSSFSLSGRVRR